jgi:hypothetical protein
LFELLLKNSSSESEFSIPPIIDDLELDMIICLASEDKEDAELIDEWVESTEPLRECTNELVLKLGIAVGTFQKISCDCCACAC